MTAELCGHPSWLIHEHSTDGIWRPLRLHTWKLKMRSVMFSICMEMYAENTSHVTFSTADNSAIQSISILNFIISVNNTCFHICIICSVGDSVTMYQLAGVTYVTNAILAAPSCCSPNMRVKSQIAVLKGREHSLAAEVMMSSNSPKLYPRSLKQ